MMNGTYLFCQSLRVDQNGMAMSEIWVRERVPQRQIADCKNSAKRSLFGLLSTENYSYNELHYSYAKRIFI